MPLCMWMWFWHKQPCYKIVFFFFFLKLVCRKPMWLQRCRFLWISPTPFWRTSKKAWTSHLGSTHWWRWWTRWTVCSSWRSFTVSLGGRGQFFSMDVIVEMRLTKMNVCSTFRFQRVDNFHHCIFGPVCCWRKGEKCVSVNKVQAAMNKQHLQAMLTQMWNFVVTDTWTIPSLSPSDCHSGSCTSVLWGASG